MQDWPSFLFTGTAVLPPLMVAIEPDAFAFAIFVFISLLTAGIYVSQLERENADEDSIGQEKREDRE